jgi:hypothetical protein
MSRNIPLPPPSIWLNAMYRDNFALPSANDNINADFTMFTSVNLTFGTLYWFVYDAPYSKLNLAEISYQDQCLCALIYVQHGLIDGIFSFGDGTLTEICIVEICHVERIPSSIVTRVLLKPAKPTTPNFISWDENRTSNSERRHWRLSASLQQICNFVIGYA